MEVSGVRRAVAAIPGARAIKGQLDASRLRRQAVPAVLVGDERQYDLGGPGPPLDETSSDAAYLAFEDEFYSTEIVDAKTALFAPYLVQAAADTHNGPVVDLGCGRGELLGRLVAAGLGATGVEINQVEFEMLTERGLPVVNTDANTYLERCADASLSGAAVIQVIEHLQPDYFLRMVALLGKKVRSGGMVVIETPNPKCLSVHGTFFFDLTHVRLYPLETVRFYLASEGFRAFRTIYSMACPPAFMLKGAPASNYIDYAIVARR